ncbi:hypothetical protein LOZ66_001313 [Ophidiomyces ophidiicola]|nr:hypothetical protein LOZ66_001313 [Ophidiomyces ophidiicola]
MRVSERVAPKRPAGDQLEHEQPLAKRFGRLRIGHPLSTAVQSVATTATGRTDLLPQARRTKDDGMQVDDTKTRVYINDLESEIAEIEATERLQHVEFLPEIEKTLMAIPKSVLNYKSETEPARDRIPRALNILDGDNSSTQLRIGDISLQKNSHEDGRKATSILPIIDAQHPHEISANSGSNGVSCQDDFDAMDIDD